MKSGGMLANNVETLYNIFKSALPKPWEGGISCRDEKEKKRNPLSAVKKDEAKRQRFLFQ